MISLRKPAGIGFKSLFSGLYFIAYAFYLQHMVEPDLIALRQDPAILIDREYLIPLLNRPGGLAETFADLLLQLFFFPMAGVLILTVLAIVLTLATLGVLRRTTAQDSGFFVAHIPSVLLLCLHSQYGYSLATTLSLLLAVMSLHLYLIFTVKPPLRPWRLPLLWILIILLHFIAGGASFYIALCVMLHELLIGRRIPMALLAAAPALLLPFLSARRWFIVTLPQAFFHLLPLNTGSKSVTPLVLLLVFYPALLILASSLSRLKLPLRFWTGRKTQAIPALLFLFIATAGALLSDDSNLRAFLQIERCARTRDWSGVLERARRQPCTMVGCSFQTNRSLAHLGLLGDDMFRYPQPWGINGLVLARDYALSAPLRKSDFYFDLGFINEAQHYAHEALTHVGPTPWILRRLALIHVLKSEGAAAEKFALALERTPYHRSWSRAIRDLIASPEGIAADPILSRIQILTPDRDELFYADIEKDKLEMLLESHPQNRMALDYLLACDLLQCRVGNFVRDLQRFWVQKSSPLPRYYQEALLFYVTLSRNTDIEFSPEVISAETRARFTAFNRIMARHRGDKQAAKEELGRKFGDTYWYYLTTFELPEGAAPTSD